MLQTAGVIHERRFVMNRNHVSPALPPNVCLHQLKKQAKDLAKARHRGDTGACSLLRNLKRFTSSSDQEILAAEIPLNEAQYALALHYGFASWDALRKHIDALETERQAHPVQEDQEGGRVILGFEKLDWGGSPQRRANSTMEAFAAILRAMGQDMPYERLMGLSGQAFRVQVARDAFCPSAACSGPGFDTERTAMVATGCPLTSWDIEHAKNRPDLDGMRKALVESINEGIPALYINEETSLIVGYQDQGKTLILRDYFKSREPGYSKAEKPAWAIRTVHPKPAPPDYLKTVTDSLRLALKLAHTESFDSYYSGFRAWDAWVNRLRHEFPEGREIEFSDSLGNWYPYASLVNARHAAGVYLNDVARLFPGDPGSQLTKAAALFDQLQQSLHARFDVVPAPWQIDKEHPWTQAQRDAQADVMEAAREMERKAFSIIQAALEKIEGTGSLG
jgi:hypothetical protein